MSLAVRHEIVGPTAGRERIRIAHLSDLHLWFGDRKLRVIEQAVAAWQPDVLALTGDYADTPMGRRLMIDWLRQMAGIRPVCWVAGNHDHWGGGSFIQKLETLSHAHAIDRTDAWIQGNGGSRYRFTSLTRAGGVSATATTREPTIVLLHDPASIRRENLPVGADCLLLAGHLHGGQITLWRDRDGRPQPASSCYRWLVDRATIGGTTLIVSRGLGDTLPVRFRAPKEIVMIDFSA